MPAPPNVNGFAFDRFSLYLCIKKEGKLRYAGLFALFCAKNVSFFAQNPRHLEKICCLVVFSRCLFAFPKWLIGLFLPLFAGRIVKSLNSMRHLCHKYGHLRCFPISLCDNLRHKHGLPGLRNAAKTRRSANIRKLEPGFDFRQAWLQQYGIGVSLRYA